MIGFYLFWCLGYLVLHSWLAKKWPKSHQSLVSKEFYQSVTLVIPFRNERPNLLTLAAELKKLASSNLEILLIDDHSEDGSREFLADLMQDIQGVQVLKSPETGKKAALDFGISQAKGEIILTTDADCKFPDHWVEKMTDSFRQSEVMLVSGPVVSEDRGTGFFEKFQQTEWFSILLLTQVSFLRKQPLMCSGANLAFRKKAFEEVEGYSGNEKWLSGDDEFLLKKVVGRFGPESFIYLPLREVLVVTNPQSKWGDLVRQRIRWSGKWKAHRSFSHACAAVFTFFVQLVWLGSIYLFVQNRSTLAFLGGIWVIKILSEKVSLGNVGASLGFKPSLGYFILTSLIHPFFVVWVGLGTLFIKVRWKGRTQEDSVI